MLEIRWHAVDSLVLLDGKGKSDIPGGEKPTAASISSISMHLGKYGRLHTNTHMSWPGLFSWIYDQLQHVLPTLHGEYHVM